MLVILLKYGENEAKKAKCCIFCSLKALFYKALNEAKFESIIKKRNFKSFIEKNIRGADLAI